MFFGRNPVFAVREQHATVRKKLSPQSGWKCSKVPPITWNLVFFLILCEPLPYVTCDATHFSVKIHCTLPSVLLPFRHAYFSPGFYTPLCDVSVSRFCGLKMTSGHSNNAFCDMFVNRNHMYPHVAFRQLMWFSSIGLALQVHQRRALRHDQEAILLTTCTGSTRLYCGR